MKQDKSRGKSEKITLNALVARLVANTPGEFSAAPPRLINSQPKALQQFVKVGLLLLLLLKNKTADYDIAQLGKQRIAFSPSSKFQPMLYLNQIPRYAHKKSLTLAFWHLTHFI